MSAANGVEEFRFLLLGKTGSGKSTTGNTILGDKLFDSDVSFESVTSECSLKRTQNKRRMIEIMDSPGLFDTSKSHEEVTSLVMQAVACMHPGPDAVLYVIKIGRYTDEEYGVYTRLKALLDDSVVKYLIVVFTHGDALNGKHIRQILERQPPCLQQVLKDCNYRYAVVDNVAKPQGQVELLLNKIRKMKESNKNVPYQCPKYAEIRQHIEEEIGQRMLSVEADELKNKKYVCMLKSSILQAKETALKEKQEMVEKEKQHQDQASAAQQQQSSLVQNMMADLQRRAEQEEARRREIIALQDALAKR